MSSTDRTGTGSAVNTRPGGRLALVHTSNDPAAHRAPLEPEAEVLERLAATIDEHAARFPLDSEWRAWMVYRARTLHEAAGCRGLALAAGER